MMGNLDLRATHYANVWRNQEGKSHFLAESNLETYSLTGTDDCKEGKYPQLSQVEVVCSNVKGKSPGRAGSRTSEL
jgi:hypothetical protein